MCWSWQVSLATWALTTGACIWKFVRKRKPDPYVGVILGLAAQIQILEFIMWLDVDGTSPFRLNYIASALATLVLWSQPFVYFYVAPLHPEGFHVFSAQTLRLFSYPYIPMFVWKFIRAAILPIYYPETYPWLSAQLIHDCPAAPYSSCYFFTRHLDWSFTRNQPWYEWVAFGIGNIGPLYFMRPFWTKGFRTGSATFFVWMLALMVFEGHLVGSVWCWGASGVYAIVIAYRIVKFVFRKIWSFVKKGILHR